MASNTSEAFNLIGDHCYDLAVLDMNLGKEMSFDLARQLIELSVPFFFVTGYGKDHTVPTDLSDIPIVSKPVNLDKIPQVLAEILGT